MPNTRKKNYTLSKKEERKEMLADLDQSRSELMNEEDNMDILEKCKQQRIHLEKIMEHVRSMTDYIESNEKKVQQLESKIIELENRDMVDVTKVEEEFYKRLIDFQEKLNAVERSQDEKRSKDIHMLSKKLDINEKKISESIEEIKTSRKLIEESEKLLNQGVGRVQEIPASIKDYINEYLNCGFDTIYENINNEKDKEQLKNCVAVLKNLGQQNHQLTLEVKEIKKQQTEEADLQAKLEKLRETQMESFQVELEELKRKNEELVAINEARAEKIEILEIKTKRMSQSSQVRFEDDLRKSSARASTEIRDQSPDHSPERVNFKKKFEKSNNYENLTVNAINSSIIARSHQQRLVAPTFNGKDRPLRYLNEMKRYLDAINADYENLRCILPNSRDWWDIIENQVDSFSDYECLFKERFWSSEAVEEIRRKLDTGKYISSGKFSRVEYTTDLISQAKNIAGYSEADLVCKLAQHHDMQVQLTVKTQKIVRYSQLIEILQCLDQAEKRERQFHENRVFQKWTPRGNYQNFSKNENTHDGSQQPKINFQPNTGFARETATSNSNKNLKGQQSPNYNKNWQNKSNVSQNRENSRPQPSRFSRENSKRISQEINVLEALEPEIIIHNAPAKKQSENYQ